MLAIVVCCLLVVSCDPDTDSGLARKPPLPRNKPIETTLQEIIAGRFRGAVDKEGHGGVLVHVRNLTVIAVAPQEDGDWHVDVTDGSVPAFITEVIPRDQARGLEQPPLGSRIQETGTPYFDTHANDPLHEYTQWEIHPVTDWRPDGSSIDPA